jgi:hypothetical protein
MAVGVVVVVGVATAWLLERQAQARLRARNQALQQQLDQWAGLSPASRSSSTAAGQTKNNWCLPKQHLRELLRLRGEFGVRLQEKSELGNLSAANRRLHSKWVDQLYGGAKLSAQEIAPYLEAKQRSAESLLAASRATGDQALLREAIEEYPNDPRVNFTAYFAFKNESSPSERRQWLDAFAQSAPDNALVNYLSAQDYLKGGQPDQAIQELMAAAAKSKFQDYLADFTQSTEEAYHTVGLSTVEAKTLAACIFLSPDLPQLRDMGQSLSDLADQYRQAGDEASAQAVLQMGASLGRRISEATGQGLPTLSHSTIGMALERRMLEALDPASPYGSSGQAVQGRLDELAQAREALDEVRHNGGYEMLQSLSEQDQLAFFDRMKASGELEALRWAQTRHAKP